jgi:alanyl-tRNA synthetase
MKLLDSSIVQAKAQPNFSAELSAEVAFQLYDSYGFPFGIQYLIFVPCWVV